MRSKRPTHSLEFKAKATVSKRVIAKEGGHYELLPCGSLLPRSPSAIAIG